MAVAAVLWEALPEDGTIKCHACAHYCTIRTDAAGRCRVRVNREGSLYSLSSDRIMALNVDPVEKKPLFHFLPGTKTYSLGTPGCNMTCVFCQNYTLSQPSSLDFGTALKSLPERFGNDMATAAMASGSASVSFTYNEPSVSMELIHAVAPACLDAGLATILVSNGYMGREGMAFLQRSIKAANFDLKSFSDQFYKKLCGASLAPVLKTLEKAVAYGWWVEITTLLIPGHNDADEELAAIARFIKENLGAHVPWHVSRFRPLYRLSDVPPTAVRDLERAREIGLAQGLHFVYTGNVAGHDGENTYCPQCGETAIRRMGYDSPDTFNGRCPGCGTGLAGIWTWPHP